MINSIRFRLTFWHVLIFAILLVSFCALVNLVFAATLEKSLDASLSSAAGMIATHLRSELAESKGDVAEAATDALEELHPQGFYAAVFIDREIAASNYPRTRNGGAWLIEAPVIAPDSILSKAKESVSPGFFTTAGFGGEGARVAALPVAISNHEGVVTVAVPLKETAQHLRSLRSVFLYTVPLMLVVAAAAGFLLARKNLSPVVAMSDQARKIGAKNLHERLKVSNERDELGHLAGVFNELLSRLDQTFWSMRNFAADASHELRTPLAIIRGEASLALERERSAAEYREALSIIQDETVRLTSLVDDLLELARADAGQRPLRCEEIYLDDLLSDCCRTVRVLAASKDIELTLSASPDVSFHGDQELLRRMVLNLLTNSIQYTNPGGRVSVHLKSAEDSLVLTVSDTGIGISPEACRHIFDRFYRVDRTQPRSEAGAGLGLAIVKWVAEAHEAALSVSSTPGQGTTFTIQFPLFAAGARPGRCLE